VYLAKATDSSFRASHPLSLDHALIVRILQGIRVQPRQGKPTTLMFGPADQAKAFSDEEAVFFAPLIATALGRATTRQVVAFGAIDPRASSPVSTAGILYVQGSSLYLTLTHYRFGLEPATRMDFPDFTRLYQLEIQFVPGNVQYAGRVPHPAPPGLGELTTLAIDYKRLATLPTPEPDRSPTATPSQSSASTKTRETDRRETELEQLREENRSLKRRLAELESEVSRLKKDRGNSRCNR
jgi:hypothetical protein